VQKLLPLLQRRVGLFVVDEARCISDWGHNFRPDYRRILQVMKLLPPGVSVLCTTATANDHVVRDIETQIPNRFQTSRSGAAPSCLVAPAL
jgi:ATP-dependent DNA helicase RecQ